MRDDSVVKGYASGLFHVARSEDLVEIVEDELYKLREVLKKNAELSEFLSNLRIAPEGKKKALKEICGDKVSLVTLNHLNLIIGKDGGEVSSRAHQGDKKTGLPQASSRPVHIGGSDSPGGE